MFNLFHFKITLRFKDIFITTRHRNDIAFSKNMIECFKICSIEIFLNQRLS